VWKWDRWYSRNPFVAFIAGLAVRGVGQQRLARSVVERHRACPYDVVYQFSNIEMPGLVQRRAQLPPIVLHPETHVAGELRWYRREVDLRRRCEPRWRSFVVRPVLAARANLQRRHAKVASLVVCISGSFRDQLLRDYGVDAARTVVVANPIALDEFVLDDHPPGTPMSVVFVGRISTRKGVDQIVELSRRLADLEGEVELSVVGGFTQWSDYRPLLADLDRRTAHELGHLPHDEVRKLLATADVAIQPSAYEPFGLTIGEALASGTPVVATDAVGATEFVGGPAVAVVPAGDPDAFERAVREMLERVRTHPELRASARAEAERAYALDLVVEQLEAALEGALGR
jgi:glycosyltransferase involved in cell wall biosynthesis